MVGNAFRDGKRLLYCLTCWVGFSLIMQVCLEQSCNYKFVKKPEDNKDLLVGIVVGTRIGPDH